MKRSTAIFFLLILVFNLYGYRLLFSCIEKNSEAIVAAKVDRSGYADDELISIKTALHLPYYSGSGEYERVFGTVEVNGEIYEYVKRRIYNDTLEVFCLPNKTKTHLKAMDLDIVKNFNDHSSSLPEKKSSTLKIYFPEYYEDEQNLVSLTEGLTSFTSVFPASSLLCGYASQPVKPPAHYDNYFC